MKTFGEIICLCGILIFKLMLCSADSGLTEDELKKTYKLSTAKGDIIDAKNYKIFKGEIVKEPTKKIWMKMENSKSLSALMHRLSISKKKTEGKSKESYISREMDIFKDLKKGKKDLLGEYVVDMLNRGTYEKKKVLIVPGLEKNLKEYSSKPYSWDKLSKIGPCMIKALRLLHDRNYVHRNLKPELFAFGTGDKVAPLKDRVYLFDIGQAEKYRHSNGSHKPCEKIDVFVGDTVFASRGAMDNRTLNRGDDMESLFYVLAYLAGITSPFEKKEFNDLYKEKINFLTDVGTVFEKSKIPDVRVHYAFFDYLFDLDRLFDAGDYKIEPEYDDFINCFDQGITEKEFKEKYKFEGSDKYQELGSTSIIARGNTTSDTSKKMEVVLKLMKSKNLNDQQSFTREIRVYRDLKRGTKHSLLRENVCDMLDYGVYDNRRALVMPRLGSDFFDIVMAGRAGQSYEQLCVMARCAINALRFIHKKGYVHRDLKLDNFAIGRVAISNAKSDKSQADEPLNNQVYLFDFGGSIKWIYANNTHRPRVKITYNVGTKEYKSRTALMRYSQSRRDDIESLMYTLTVAVTRSYIFGGQNNTADEMWYARNEFVTAPNAIPNTFNYLGVTDNRIHNAFQNYADELNKLFLSDGPEHYEMEPNYNAFCVCFDGKPGDKACAVD